MNIGSYLNPPLSLKVEACIGQNSLAKESSIVTAIKNWLQVDSSLYIEQSGPLDLSKIPNTIRKHISKLNIVIEDDQVQFPICISLEKYEVIVFAYRLNYSDLEEEEEENGEFSTFSIVSLPHVSLEGIWESLVYDDKVKQNLLNYVYTAMEFSRLGVDSNQIGWNRVVLLHGPPGTGKTSLCKALSHKLAVRLMQWSSFQEYCLIEINAHSLFSKWFSESGKLVMKMFSSIREIAEDPLRFVVILIDEVESLTAARSKAMEGSEPSDAIRVVNAVLTQLDKLKTFRNVLVMTTSNITGAIDDAFLDRADIVQYIGNPSLKARYQIMTSCISELQKKGFLKEEQQQGGSTRPNQGQEEFDDDIIEANDQNEQNNMKNNNNNNNNINNNINNINNNNNDLNQQNTDQFPRGLDNEPSPNIPNPHPEQDTSLIANFDSVFNLISSILHKYSQQAPSTLSSISPSLSPLPLPLLPSSKQASHSTDRKAWVEDQLKLIIESKKYDSLVDFLILISETGSHQHNGNDMNFDASCRDDLMDAESNVDTQQKPILSQSEITSIMLIESCLKLDGLSGRALRKVPFVTAAVNLQGSSCSTRRFVKAIGEREEQRVVLSRFNGK